MTIKINYKAVLTILAVLLVCGTGIHFLHAFQVQRNAQGLYSYALAKEEDGDKTGAIKLLGKYVGMVPEDKEALARLALLLEEAADTPFAARRAYLMLEQAIQADDSRADLRRRAARLAVRMRRYADARAHLRLVPDGDKNGEVQHLLARCEAGEGKFADARQPYARAVTLSPQDVDAWLEFADLLRDRLKEPENADELIEQMIAGNPKTLRARTAAVRYYQRTRNLDRAETHLRFALRELSGEDAEVYILAAELARFRGNHAEARKLLEQGRQRVAAAGSLTQALALLELEEGHRDKARQLVEPFLKELPRRSAELARLASIFLELDELDKAERVLNRLAKQDATPVSALLQARLLMKKESWGDARVLLEKTTAAALPAELARNAHAMLAACYRQLQNPDGQTETWRRALLSDPLSATARRGLALSLVEQGKLDQGIDEYRKIALLTPDMRVELAGLLLARQAQQAPDEHNLLAVEKLLKDVPGEEGVKLKLLRAELLLARNRDEEARQLILAEQKRDPRNSASWLFLMRLAARQGKGVEIPGILDEAQKQTGPRLEWELARVNYWLRAASAETPGRLAKIESAVDRLGDADGDRLRGALARAYFALGDLGGAQRLAKALAARQPANLAMRTLLVEIALAEDKEADLERLVEEIGALEGARGPLGGYARACMHFLRAKKGDKDGLHQARRLLQTVALQRPSWSRVPRLEGQMFDLENRSEQALEKYQAALERGEGRLEVIRRTVQILLEQRRFAEAQALLQKLPSKALSVPQLGRPAAALAILAPESEGKQDPLTAARRGLELARKTVGIRSQNYREFLWLGQVASLAGERAEAEKAFRRALELNDAAPECWTALVYLLARDNPKQAQAELARAGTKLAAKHVPLVLASGQEVLGNLRRAEQHYQAAVEANPGDAATLLNIAAFYGRHKQQAKRTAYLQQLVNTATQAAPALLSGARRDLALALAMGGTYSQFKQAVALLDKNKGTIEDRWVRALVLATQPVHRQEAIKLLEKSVMPQVTVPPDIRLVLARLYDADERWSSARAQFLALMKEHETNPNYVAAFVQALVRHEEKGLAQTWVERLAKLAPNHPGTVELRARVLKAQGKIAQAAEMLKKYAAGKDVPLYRVAALLDQLGESKAAEELLRSRVTVKAATEKDLMLAQFLGKQKRTAEALAVCARCWRTCRPEAVGAVCLGIVRAGPATAAQKKQVETWIADAVRKHLKVVLLSTYYAEILDFSGKHEEAMAVHREILKKEPSNVVSLNNLAFMLSLREEKSREALKMIDMALELAGPVPALLDTRACIHLRHGRPELAIADLHQAIALSPSPARYMHLAQAQLQNRNRTAARESYQKGLAAGFRVDSWHPWERDAYTRLARALE